MIPTSSRTPKPPRATTTDRPFQLPTRRRSAEVFPALTGRSRRRFADRPIRRSVLRDPFGFRTATAGVTLVGTVTSPFGEGPRGSYERSETTESAPAVSSRRCPGPRFGSDRFSGAYPSRVESIAAGVADALEEVPGEPTIGDRRRAGADGRNGGLAEHQGAPRYDSAHGNRRGGPSSRRRPLRCRTFAGRAAWFRYVTSMLELRTFDYFTPPSILYRVLIFLITVP
jgi:hypothetical protein